jgi:hypothetical protein
MFAREYLTAVPLFGIRLFRYLEHEMPLVLNYGNAATGDSRFPRPDLEARFMRTLRNSAGIKMFGLRRIGKSTMRLYAMEQLQAERRTVAYIDGQGLLGLGDFLGRLSSALPGEKGLVQLALKQLSSGPIKAALDALVAGTEYEERAISAYWRLLSEAISKSLAAPGAKPVLIVDEFPYLIANMIRKDNAAGRDDADRLLASMREWRGAGMSMLLTGSIGLTGLARKNGLNIEHLNDLQPFGIPELSREEAVAFIKSALEGFPTSHWTDEHTDEFLKQSGVLYPCFLVRGLLEIGLQDPPLPKSFAEIFRSRVRPELHRDFYDQFDRRFLSYRDLPDEQRDALILPALKAIMSTENGCAHDAIPCDPRYTNVDLAIALNTLVEDGFVQFVEDEDGEREWRSASKLVGHWWKKARLA